MYNTKSNPSELQENSGSVSEYKTAAVIQFPKQLPNSNLVKNISNETVFGNINGHKPANDCNTSFVSLSDDAREISEADSDQIANISLESSSISSSRKKLDRAKITRIDPITTKENTFDNVETPRSPTMKKHHDLPGTNCSKSLGTSNSKTPNKTSLTQSCNMCNVIVNSAAQLTQVFYN